MKIHMAYKKKDIEYENWCKNKRKEIKDKIIKEFIFLSDEQKIDKLIDIYATSVANKYNYCYHNFYQDKNKRNN